MFEAPRYPGRETAAGIPSRSVTGGGTAPKASAIRTILLKNDPM